MEFALLSMILIVSLCTGKAIQYYYMDQNCGETIDVPLTGAIKLELTSSVAYSRNLDCSLTIKSSGLRYDRLMLHFENIDMNCNQAFLEVRDGVSSNSSYVSGFKGPQCGSDITSSVKTTSSRYIYLRFKSGDMTYWSSGFTMIIVQYHTGNCYTNEYSCGNGRCIDESVVCNGYNPCGDYLDCPVLVAGAIVGIVIGSLVFVFVIIAIINVIIRRRRSRPYHRYVNVMVRPGYGAPGYN